MNFIKPKNLENYFNLNITASKDNISAILQTGLYSNKAEQIINETVEKIDEMILKIESESIGTGFSSEMLKAVPQMIRLETRKSSIVGFKKFINKYFTALKTCTVRDHLGQICVFLLHDPTKSKINAITDFSRIMSWKTSEDKLNWYFDAIERNVRDGKIESRFKTSDFVKMNSILNGEKADEELIGRPFNPFEACEYKDLTDRCLVLQICIANSVINTKGLTKFPESLEENLKKNNEQLIEQQNKITEFLNCRETEC